MNQNTCNLLETHRAVKTAINAITVCNILLADVEEFIYIEAQERPELEPYHESMRLILQQMTAAEVALRKAE